MSAESLRAPRQEIRKPDPDEPWRYVCPDCGGQVNGHPKSWRYRCQNCAETFEAEDLYDKKTDRYGVSFHT